MTRDIKRKIKKWFLGDLNKEITPDEIFLDSSNLPGFDVDQFEGRLEKPISRKVLYFLMVCFLMVALLFSSKLWFLQIKEGEAYLARSENNRLRHNIIFSNRGVIYDRNDEELAFNSIHPDGKEFAIRKYLDLPGLSHVLGYIKYPTKDKAGFYWETNFNGKDGIEKYYNDTLSGENGLQIIEVDVGDNPYSQSVVKVPKDGESITLSIDSRVQSKLFEIISKAASDFGFQGGAGAIMDVQTGELLSIVSFPEFNSSILSDGSNVSEIEEFFNDPHDPFLNRVVSGLYTPGSIVKPFVALAALNENIINPNKEILSTGSISVPNPYFPDLPSIFTDWKAHGLVDMVDALAVSSNIYFYYIGGGFGDQKGLGIGKIEEYARKFGLAQETGIDLSVEVEGTIPNPAWKKEVFGDDWRLGDTYNTVIGQYGFQVTPIQVLRAMAALANGGILLEPRVAKTSENPNSKTILDIKSEAFDVVREGMRQAVERGTASGLGVPYVQVAAKTGTAEIGKSSLNSWVTGFFPYQNPKYAFVVIMERGPRSNSIGGTYVMRQLLDWMNINTPEYFK